MSLSYSSRKCYDLKSEDTPAIENSGLQLPAFRSIFGGHWDALDGMLTMTDPSHSQPHAHYSDHDYSEVLERLASSLDSPSDEYSQTNFDQSPIFTPNLESQESHMDHQSFYAHKMRVRPEFLPDLDDSKMSLMSSSNDTLHEGINFEQDYGYDASNCLSHEMMPEYNPHTIASCNSKRSYSSSTLDYCQVKMEAHDHGLLEDSIYKETPRKKPSGKFVCTFPGCGKEFTRKANRRAHIATHNPNRSRPFACLHCPKAYLRSVDLARHVEISHEKSSKHVCHDCRRSFTRKEGLQKHLDRGNCTAF